MSEYQWDEQADMSGDSDLVKRLRKEIEKRDNALKERDGEFAKLQSEVRRNSVSGILRDLGVKPKVANLIPAEIEANPEAVKAWVSEYEDVFGSARAEEAPKAEEANEGAPAKPDGQPAFTDEQVQAWTRLQTSDTGPAMQVPTGDDAQIQFLRNAADKANGDPDRYFSFLRGEITP